MLTADFDAKAGLIRCTSEGFLTIADVQQFTAQIRQAVARSHRQFGYTRTLFRKVDTSVQSAEVMAALAKEKWPTADPRDRMALVVTSNLARLQAARSFRTGQDRAFASEAEALAWLTEDHPLSARTEERRYG